MEETNIPLTNPHNSTADLLSSPETRLRNSSPAANFSYQPSDGISKVLGRGQIASEEAESLDNNKNKCSGNKLQDMISSDILSENGKVVSSYKTGLHCHQDQRRMIVAVEPSSSPTRRTIDLGNGSHLIYIQRFLPFQQSWTFFDYLDNHIPWTRPTIRVFGRSCLQPRDTCYVASSGLTDLVYSGYRPNAYSWDDFPPLKEILDAICKALPGSRFNSLLLNRYKGANDYVGWHADDEKLYGPTPEIASVSFGCERDFVLKKKTHKESSLSNGNIRVTPIIEHFLDKKRQEQTFVWYEPAEKTGDGGPARKRLKRSSREDQQSLKLKHGSLLVMRGYTQRDWIHSVPKRAKAEGTRINLTFRLVL